MVPLPRPASSLTRLLPSLGSRFTGGSARLRKAFSLAGLGQTKAAKRGSRSIVYLTDSAEYSGGDVELSGKGSTPEGLAKNWSTEAPR